MSTKNTTPTSFVFAVAALEVVRKAQSLIVITTPGAKSKPVFEGNQRAVKGYMSAITALELGQFAEMKVGSFYYHKPLAEIVEMVKLENAGYVRGSYLSVLIQGKLAKRNKAIDPKALYRLTWDNEFFTTAEVVYKEYEEGEYTGIGGPQHNRNTLNLISSIEKLAKLYLRGENLILGTATINSLYLDKIFATWAKIAKGKLEEAKELRGQGITAAAVRSTVNRLTRLSNGQKDETGEAFKPSAETLRMIDGTDVPLNELFGKTVAYYTGEGKRARKMETQADVIVSDVNAAALVTASKRHYVRFAVVESK